MNTAFVPLIAGLWAAIQIVYASAKITNERRQIILSGKIGAEPVTLEHRKLILYCDWVPMTIMIITVCIIYAIILMAVPAFFEEDLGIALVCYAASSIPGVGAMAFAVAAVFEYRLMCKTLA